MVERIFSVSTIQTNLEVILMSTTNQTNYENFIQDLIEKKTKVSIYLVNGIKLQGTVEFENADSVILTSQAGAPQKVYKHATSTIVPAV